ncbi:hypothetical protein [Xylophilus sp. GOD-11R]|uniref:hypothetical protein n=1 Tax=Xylophilus sp. GOD-11R TaxID=3089814 RepID=UPI00298C1DDB|nr:hypothetical protein [Xylophilus sp. GOD-11R]WPB57278.1 hypothetical protein R9X41_01060 [Xylophilus sp. GOD-11R]
MQTPSTNEKEKGETRSAREHSDDGQVPRTPNEHDTSADSQTGGQSTNGVSRAAAKDAASGKQDTDKGPVMDQVYDKVRQGTPDPDRKR